MKASSHTADQCVLLIAPNAEHSFKQFLGTDVTQEQTERSAGSTARVNAALLPLGDFRRIPGDGVRTNRNRCWQHA